MGFSHLLSKVEVLSFYVPKTMKINWIIYQGSFHFHFKVNNIYELFICVPVLTEKVN